MRVVNTKTSNTVLSSNKQLAEGSHEVSVETGHVQGRQGWAAAVVTWWQKSHCGTSVSQ